MNKIGQDSGSILKWEENIHFRNSLGIMYNLIYFTWYTTLGNSF